MMPVTRSHCCLSGWRPYPSFRLAVLLAMAGLLLAVPAALASTSWKGTSSTAWSTSGNWTAGVPTATVDAIIGDANFTGANQPSISATSVCKSLTLGTGAKASTLTISRGLTVSGNITIGANGLISHTSTSTTRAISLTGNWTNSGTYSGTTTSAAVTFRGTLQSIGGSTATSFRRLTLSAGSVTTLASNLSVANALAVSGTLVPGSTDPGFVVSGAGTLSVANGGKILVRASTFAGNYALSGTKSLSAGNTVDYAATSIAQTVSNTLTYSTLRSSGGGVKTLAGTLPTFPAATTTAGNIDVAAGTLDLSTFTISRATTTVGGTVSVAAGATLKIGGTRTFPANFATHSLSSTSTVEYSGDNQTVTAEAYGHLTLSGSTGAVVKTMPASALSIAGNLTASQGTATTVAFTAGGAFTVGGNVVLGSATTFTAGTFSHSVGGNWINNGTFAGGTSSTVTMNGVNAVMSGAGASNFYNLVIARSGITADANTSLNVAGNFSTSGAGTFTHSAGGSGTLTMSGTSKTLSGTGISFSKLTLTGSVTTAASFTVADNLTVNGSLAASAGTITLSGTTKTISGGGTLAFSALAVPGSITTGNSFSLSGNLTVPGGFTATAGTVTFNGSTVFSGTANLFNTALNGTLLQMGADSILGLAGTTTLTAGTFDVTTQRPNTVVYNSASSQTVYPIPYDNLEIAVGGTKTAGGSFYVWSDLKIDSGAVFSGGAGSYTISVRHHWLNNSGTFNAGNSTVEMVGPNDSTVAGATTFNVLRVNKDASSLLVNLSANQTTSTLDMLLGTLDTGSHTLTLTNTRSGAGHVLGTITRQHSFSDGTAYAFEGPLTTITFAAPSGVTAVTMTTTLGSIADFPSGAAVNRQYTVSLNSGATYSSAALRTYYQDTELNGNVEANLVLWRNDGSVWASTGKTGNNTTDNWVEDTAITTLTGRWTLSSGSGVARWTGAVSTAWETAANWTGVSGVPSLPPAAVDIAELGTAAVPRQPTITSAAAVRSIVFGSAQAMTLTLGVGGTVGVTGIQTTGNVGGTWTTNIDHTLNVGAQTMTVGGDLTLSDGTDHHTINLNLGSGAVTVAGNLVQSGGASIIFTDIGTLNIGGSYLYTSGTFTASTGTVTYNGSGAQTVAGVTYNQLVFNKAAGIATLPTAATVTGNLTLSTGGRLQLDANLAVMGNVTMGAGTTLDLGGMALDLGGNWVCSGTLDISSGGEVALVGTGAQSIGACAFHDLDINKTSGTATLAGNISVVLDVDVDKGTLDLATYTVNQSAAGAVLTVAAGAQLRTPGSFPTGFTTTSLAPTSTVEYYGSASQTVAEETYGHLNISNGGSNAKTLAGPTTVAGDLLINNAATLAASTYSLTLQGNWTNSGTFSAGTGTVILSGTGKTVAGATTFNNLTVPGSYTSGDYAVTIQGNTTILGSYTTGSGATTTLDGDLNNAGTFQNNGTLTFSGTRVQDFVLNAGFHCTGTVNFNGSVSPYLHSTTSPHHNHVNINNTGGVTTGIGWLVDGTFTVGSGATFNGNIFTHTFYGTVTNNGTMSSSGTFDFSPSSDTTLTLGNTFSSSGTVAFSGSHHLTLVSGALSLGSVHVANTHAAGLTPVSNWTLTGDLQIDSGAVFHAGSALTHKIAGNVSNEGTLDGGTSTVEFNGTSELGGAGSTVFYHLKTSGSLTCVGAIAVTGNFTNNGTFDATGADVTFSGSAASAISGTTTPTPIDSLVIAKTSATVTLNLNVSSLTSLTISSGTLDTGTYTLAQNGSSGTLSVSASGTLKLGGTNSFPIFAAGVTLDPGSTVDYAGGAQTVAAITYANLRLSGSGNKTLGAITTINGNVNIVNSDGAKFNLSYSQSSTSSAGSLSYVGVLQLQNTTYGSSTSTAAHKDNTNFLGDGLLTVGSVTLDHFAVTVSGPQTAGTAFTVTITAQDANDVTVPTFGGTVDLTETGDGAGGTVTPTPTSPSTAFTAGLLSSQTVTLTKAGAAVTLTVADHAGTGKTGISDPFTVNPGAISDYVVSAASPQTTRTAFLTTVTARDANANPVTTDNATVVTLTSSGSAQFDGDGNGTFGDTTKTLSSGTFTISTKDDEEESLTLTATSTGGKTGTSSSITVSAASGDFRSHQTGPWNDASTWERWNGASWVTPAPSIPSSADQRITIRNLHTVTLTADLAADQVTVLFGGQLSVNPAVTLTLEDGSGTDLDVNSGGALAVMGTGLVFGPGSLLLAAGASLQIGASAGITSVGATGSIQTGSRSFDPGANYTYNGPTAQVTGDGLPTTLTGNLTDANSAGLSLTSSLTLNLPSVCTVNNGATLTLGTSTIGGSGTFTLASGGTLQIGSAEGIVAGLADTTHGNIRTTTARNFPTGANYTYNGTLAQVTGSGLPATVNLLTSSNTASSNAVVSLSNDVTVSTTLALTNGALALGAHTLTLNDAISRTSGTLTGGSNSAIVFAGTGSAANTTLPAVTSGLQNLTLNRANGITLGASLELSGGLTLTSGNLATGAYQVSLATAATATRTSGWVNGTLKKAFNSGASQAFTFPIGGQSYYRPLALAGLNVTTAGTLAASVTSTAGDHPESATSGIDPNHDVTRYWTLTAGGGLLVGSYALTLYFDASDVSSGADWNYFVVRKWNGNAWSTTGAGTLTSTSSAATSLNSFGDFVVGEPLASRLLVTLPGQTFTNGSGNSGPVSSQTAGASFNLNLRAVDLFNTVDPTYVGLHTITYTGPANAPNGAAPVYTTSVLFTNGETGDLATILKLAETTTITATNDILPGVASDPLTSAPAAASQLAFTSSPVTVTAGSASGSITVQRQDPYGNPNTTDASRSVTLASNSSGTVTFNPVSPLSITSASSSTSFTYTDTKAGTPTVTAASTSPSTITSATQQETVNPGPVDATTSTLLASPTSVAADGSATSTITVTLKDAAGNPLPGKSVSLAQTSGAGTPTITTVLNVTNPSGQGSWTVKSTTAAVDVFTATDTSADVTVSQTATVTFTAGAVTHYRVTFSSPPFYAGIPFTTYATAKDAYNNTVTTHSATVSFSSTSLTLKWDSDGSGSFDKVGLDIQKATVDGVAAISTKDDTSTALMGVTVTADDGTYSGTSSAIDIDIAAGAYHTKASGDWSTYGSVWETWNGSSWVSASAAPTYTDGVIMVRSGHAVTVAADVSVDQVHIESGGSILVSNGRVLTVVSNAQPGLEVYGTLNNNGTVTVNSGATLYVYDSGVMDNTGTVNSDGGSYGNLTFYGGTYKHSFTSLAGAIPLATWTTNSQKSTCQITGYTSNTGTPGGLNQSFQNVVWNCPSQTGAISLGGGFATVDSFTVSSTGSGSIALAANLNATTRVTVGSGARLDGGTYTISGAAFDLQVGGTLGIGAADGILSATAFGNIQTTTRHFSSGANYIYNGSAAQVTGSGLPVTVHGLTVSNSAGVTLSADVVVNDTLTLTSGALSLGAHTLTVNDAITTTGGSLTGGATSAIVIADNGTAANTTLPTVSGGLQYLTVNRANGVTLGGAVTVTGTLTLTSGNVSSANNLSLGSGASLVRATGSLSGTPTFSGTVNVTYTAPGVITGTELPTATGNVLQALSFNQASGTVTLAADVTANGTVTLAAGATFADGGFTLTAKGNMANAGTASGAGRIALAGSISQTVSGTGSYSNLELNNGAGASLTGASTVNGTLFLTAGTLTNGVNLTLANGATISRAVGALGTAPTFGATVNLIYTGTTGVTAANEMPAAASVLNNLTLSYASSATLTLAADATVNGLLTLGANSTLADAGYILTAKGDVTNSGTHSGTGNIRLDNPASQTLSGSGTYGNLELYQGYAGLNGSPTISGTLTLSSGGQFVVGANTLTLTGPGLAGTPTNLTANALSSLVFAGSSVNLPSSVTQLNDLTLANSNGLTLTGNLEIDGTLTLTSGNLTTGAYQVSLATAATWTRTSGWVNGTLKKTFNPGASQSFTFPIGENYYRPVALAGLNVTTAGTLAASVTSAAGNHPQMATSGLNPSLDVTRYWTLTAGSSLVVSSYGATFTFDATDVSSGADWNHFVVRKWNGSAWSTTSTGTRTSTSIAAIGLNSFSDFVLGEPLASRLLVTLPGETFTDGSGNAGTVSNQTAGTAFDLALRAVDSFNTVDANYAGTKTIAYSGPGGSGGNAPVYTTSVTFSSGQATSVPTTLKLAETTTITATDSLLTGLPSSTLNVTVAAANQLVFTSQPSPSTVAGVPFATQPVVKIEDAYGNLVVSGLDATRSVTLTLTTGTGTLGGTPSMNAVAGVANFAGQGLNLNLVGADKVLTATATLTAGVTTTTTSPDFAITPGALHHFAVSTPSTQTAGTAFSLASITAQDVCNNTVPSFVGTVDLTETGGGAGGTVSPLTSDAFVAGGRSNQSVTLSRAGSGVTLTATNHDGSETGLSGTFTVNAAAPTKLQILLPGEVATPDSTSGKAGTPTEQTVGMPISSGVVVNAVDPYWNVVSSATPNVTISSSDGSATIADDNGGTPGHLTLVNGTGTLSSFTFMTAGMRTITATDAASGLTSNTSPEVLVSKVKAPTTLTLVSSANPSNPGASVTFTATLSENAATGTVTFKDGAATLGTGTLSAGVATYTTSTLNTGIHSLAATYAGDADYAACTSNTLTQAVKATTTLALISSANPSVAWVSVTFTATLSESAATGTVMFRDGATLLGSPTVVAGVASLVTNALSAGSHSLTAEYSGDGFHTASTSNTLTQVVTSSPTLAVIGRFCALRETSGLVIQWETVSEVGSLAFNLYREDAAAATLTRVTTEALSAVGEAQGGVYRALEVEAAPGASCRYLVEELQADGSARRYGPFEVLLPVALGGVSVASLDGPASAVTEPLPTAGQRPGDELLLGAWPHPVDPLKTARGASRESELAQAAAKASTKAAETSAIGSKALANLTSRLRIKVATEGLKYLSAATIATGLGSTLAEVRQALLAQQLELSCQGTAVAYAPATDGAGLYFYGRAYRSPYTIGNVYWLQPGTGLVVPPASVGAATGAPLGSFAERVHREEDNDSRPDLLAAVEDGLWLWGLLQSDVEEFRTRSLEVDLPGLATDGGLATVTVRLHGANNTAAEFDHETAVEVKGKRLGSSPWDGLVPHEASFTLDAKGLLAGRNTVVVRALAPVGSVGTTSRSYLDWVEVSYPRRFAASGNSLVFGVSGGASVAVSGFSSAGVMLFDISDPARLAPVSGATVAADGKGAYTLSFSAAPGASRYASLLPTAAEALSGTLVLPSGLRSPTLAAAHLIIAPPELLAAAQALAAYRSAQGLNSRVVSLTDIYNDFNQGIPEPGAVTAFLRWAAANWSEPPRYVVLAGDGTTDYRNLKGMNDNLMPPLLAPTAFGLFASDNAFADLTGDGLPDLAIGRLPVMTAAELTTAISKIVAYETAAPRSWAFDAVVATDRPDDGGDFTSEGKRLLAGPLNGLTVKRVFLADLSLAQSRELLLKSLRFGACITSWTGHGGLDRLSRAGVLTTTDLSGLANAGRPTVLVAASCLIGRFEIPGYDCLAERLLLLPSGGAVAVWSPSALSYNEVSRALTQRVYTEVFAGARERLGDAILATLRSYVPPPGSGTAALDPRTIYNLLGDPALQLHRKGQ